MRLICAPRAVPAYEQLHQAATAEPMRLAVAVQLAPRALLETLELSEQLCNWSG